MGVELAAHEIEEYLQARPRVVLCINRPGRPPMATPMWFAWIDGQVWMHTLLASRKVDYIRADPNVTCLVESGQHYYELKAVQIRGPCEVVDDPEQVRAGIARMNEAKPLYGSLRPASWPPHLERHYAKPRALLRVTPQRITTWDFSKIRR